MLKKNCHILVVQIYKKSPIKSFKNNSNNNWQTEQESERTFKSFDTQRTTCLLENSLFFGVCVGGSIFFSVSTIKTFMYRYDSVTNFDVKTKLKKNLIVTFVLEPGLGSVLFYKPLTEYLQT